MRAREAESARLRELDRHGKAPEEAAKGDEPKGERPEGKNRSRGNGLLTLMAKQVAMMMNSI